MDSVLSAPQTSIYSAMTTADLAFEVERLKGEVKALKSLGLKLDMARGKPSPEQVGLSRPLLDAVNASSDLTDEGVDAANYGAPDGLPSARRLFAQILEVDPAQIIVSGSSSLNLMFDVLAHGFVCGIQGETPWCQQQNLKFLCPSPGYDRHFAVSEHFGFENVPVTMTATGPDMDQVEELVKDPAVKGIWCVPKYQNPTGVTFSDETVRRFAALKPAAPDFRILWDNAYVVHGLYPHEEDSLLEIFSAIEEAGGSNLVYEFASTSKITFPGSGIACVAASVEDLADLRRSFGIERVCADKINQLMHTRVFADASAVKEHMDQMAQVLRPRFELVEAKLAEQLGEVGCAAWTCPRGGYFVSFEAPEGCAKAIVDLCREVGVTLTGAGATWPYGDDPRDSNIRLAPSYPTLQELGEALDVFCACVKAVAAAQELERRS